MPTLSPFTEQLSGKCTGAWGSVTVVESMTSCPDKTSAITSNYQSQKHYHNTLSEKLTETENIFIALKIFAVHTNAYHKRDNEY